MTLYLACLLVVLAVVGGGEGSGVSIRHAPTNASFALSSNGSCYCKDFVYTTDYSSTQQRIAALELAVAGLARPAFPVTLRCPETVISLPSDVGMIQMYGAGAGGTVGSAGGGGGYLRFNLAVEAGDSLSCATGVSAPGDAGGQSTFTIVRGSATLAAIAHGGGIPGGGQTTLPTVAEIPVASFFANDGGTPAATIGAASFGPLGGVGGNLGANADPTRPGAAGGKGSTVSTTGANGLILFSYFSNL